MSTSSNVVAGDPVQAVQYVNLRTDVIDSAVRELSVLAAIAPLSGYAAATLESVESGGAGTAKPVIPQLRFVKTAANGRQWRFRVRAVPAATIVLKITGRMSGANVSKAIVMGCQVAAVSVTDSNVANKAFDTTNTATTTVPDTANVQFEVSITLTNKDSMAKGDDVCLFIYRDALVGGDTAAGDFLVTSIGLSYV
jgi:hypothetical protein